ncbi:S41 family peptidase [Dysgonomonas reticulitermitis]
MKVKLVFLLLLLLSFNACKDTKEEDGPNPEPNPKPSELTDDEFTNQWAYNKMKSLYLWNTNLPSKPDYTQDPEAFFKSILYNYGNVNGDRFSWIEEDTSKKTKALYADTNLGFEYLPMNYFPTSTSSNTSIGFFVLYVYEGSDAYKKGLRRGQVIYKVNNVDVNYNNYSTLLKDVSSVSLSVYNNKGEQVTFSSIQTTESKKSPVFISKVITATTGAKIGYLMYTGFERNSDDKDNNYEYDIELIESIRTLNSQGITEFVLDLRYNPGGYLTSAMDSASALVPNRKPDNVFAKEAYNTHFQDSIVKKYGANVLNEYFLDKVYGTNTAIPNLNLTRLYVLAGEYTASASELIIHGLRPYMTVAHIGETTVGKDKASMTVKSDNSRIKWQLQPLISRLTDANGKGNYINGLAPGIGAGSGDASYKVSELEEGYTMQAAYYADGNGNRVETQCPLLSKWTGGLKELGDPSEPLLAEAIAKITGVARVKTKSASTSDRVPVQVPRLKYNEERQRIIIDQDKFSGK